MKKLYILDTNIALYDPNVLSSIKDGDVCIPLIVLEEIDKFKKGNDGVNLSARAFLRNINKITDGSNSPWKLPNGNELIIELDTNSQFAGIELLDSHKADTKILASVWAIKLRNQVDSKWDEIIFLSKDVSLRLKAKAVGISAEDYDADVSARKLWTGWRIINSNQAVLDELNMNGTAPAWDIEAPQPNEYFVLVNGSQSSLAKFKADQNSLVLVRSHTVMGITPRNVQQIFALDALLDDSIPLVTLTGVAGTGKTLLMLAAAFDRHSSTGPGYNKIYISKSTASVGAEQGFLPGNKDEKITPHLSPFYDNLSYLEDACKLNHKAMSKISNARQDMEIEALTYVRGRSFNSTFYCMDEVQNLTPHEVKTLVTRMGNGTKLILSGDIDQIDVPYLDKESNGLFHVISKFKAQGLHAQVHLTKSERSPLAEMAGHIL